VTELDVLIRWLNDARKRQIAHLWTNGLMSVLHQILGSILIILSAITASVFFGEALTVDSVKYTVSGVLGIITTIVAALQTSLKLSEKAEKHLGSSAQYGNLRRELEAIGMVFTEITQDELKTKAADINQKQVELDKKRSYIPQPIYWFAQRHVDKDKDEKNVFKKLKNGQTTT